MSLKNGRMSRGSVLKCFNFVLALLLVTCEAYYPPSTSSILRLETEPPVQNCRDVHAKGHNTNGIYTIFPYKCCPHRPLKVYCDMETDGGGWTVIQRRDVIEPREDFYRTWMEYALGFGNLNGEFWIGNDAIHELTDQAFNEIRFDLEDFEGNARWALYKFFYVYSRDLNFKMEVNGYSGDATDSFRLHDGGYFSTKDKDLDTNLDNNCASMYTGAWWYKVCSDSNLNGQPLSGTHDKFGQGIEWEHWLGSYYSLKRTEMKIRPSYS